MQWTYVFFTQTDISGKCEIMYKPLGSGKIEKTKDVIGCVGGHGYETVFKGVPYESASVSSTSINTLFVYLC